ncbi:MAG: ribonuclease PH [Chthoniobacterales bacterium]
MTTRSSGRSPNQLREINIETGIAPHAGGSALIGFGKTRVICAASIEEGVPRWMKEQNVSGGWLTAEYSMLPYSTLSRKARDISRGKMDGRGTEIQRLIGRSLRAVVDLEALGSRTLWVDCDVLQADGGTRTASITGACIAIGLAGQKLLEEKKITRSPLKDYLAAISVGVVRGDVLLDLEYVEDRDAEVDLNLVMTGSGDFVEIQASGEEATFSANQLSEMIEFGRAGIVELVERQKAIIGKI